MTSEFEFIERLRGRLPTTPEGQVWIGDDAAVIADGRLFATDVLVEGVHFDLDWCASSDVGWKALAVNVSDIAAMGGRPTAAVVSVVIPPGRASVADQIADGLLQASEAMDCPLVGGDTSSGPALMLSVAILGDAPETGSVLRSGAQVGDSVFVTGTLGSAASALAAYRAGTEPDPDSSARLHRPTPRLDEGEAAAVAGATAMIDVSDGLAADLAHIARESGVGGRIDADWIPREPTVEVVSAIRGGDDYELCFTAPDPMQVGDAFLSRQLGQPTRIGEIIAAGGGDPAAAAGARDLALVVDGSPTEWPAGGWEHDLS